ncbi:MAG: class I SAM-dependent methyltransferase [Elusimicrobia bacterium]|nr:class I SAM-dependent methyltransferase [Elusimicrobiota bacterium]
MEPKEFFWPFSAIYSSITKWMQPAYSDIVQRTGINKNHKILLDIGGGDGRLAMEFAKQYPCLTKIISADISSDMVKRAKKNIRKKNLEHQILSEIQDVHNLTYPDDFFDVIVSFGALHHWRNPVKALTELSRVLKSKGVLTIYDGFDRPRFKTIRNTVSTFGGSFVLAMAYWVGSKDTLKKEEIKKIAENSNIKNISLNFTSPLVTLKYIKP